MSEQELEKLMHEVYPDYNISFIWKEGKFWWGENSFLLTIEGKKKNGSFYYSHGKPDRSKEHQIQRAYNFYQRDRPESTSI